MFLKITESTWAELQFLYSRPVFPLHVVGCRIIRVNPCGPFGLTLGSLGGGSGSCHGNRPQGRLAATVVWKCKTMDWLRWSGKHEFYENLFSNTVVTNLLIEKKISKQRPKESIHFVYKDLHPKKTTKEMFFWRTLTNF